MSDLTDDEFAVLLIAQEGASMIPIGRWEKPIRDLTARGYMRRDDDVNYTITPQGRDACTARDNADMAGLLNAHNNLVRQNTKVAPMPQVPVREFAEQAARALADTATASARVTGEPASELARKWSALILDRALEMLR